MISLTALDRVRGQHHRAEYVLLGFEILGWQRSVCPTWLPPRAAVRIDEASQGLVKRSPGRAATVWKPVGIGLWTGLDRLCAGMTEHMFAEQADSAWRWTKNPLGATSSRRNPHPVDDVWRSSRRRFSTALWITGRADRLACGDSRRDRGCGRTTSPGSYVVGRFGLRRARLGSPRPAPPAASVVSRRPGAVHGSGLAARRGSAST